MCQVYSSSDYAERHPQKKIQIKILGNYQVNEGETGGEKK